MRDGMENWPMRINALSGTLSVISSDLKDYKEAPGDGKKEIRITAISM